MKACNIDAKGKAVRLVMGIVECLVAVALFITASLGLWTGPIPWILGGIMLLTGPLAIYEGWAGWCVVRGMGFKTPI